MAGEAMTPAGQSSRTVAAEPDGITAPLAHHARHRPNGIALSMDGTRLSWAELHDQMETLAARIAVLVPPGRGVALDLPAYPAAVLLVLAVARAGREVLVPDPAWPEPTLRAVVDDLRPAWLVTTRALAAVPNVRILRIPPNVDPDRLGEALGLDTTPPSPPPPWPAPDQPFYVGFTSGSTGRPKGFRRSHLSWIRSFEGEAQLCPLTPGEDAVLIPGSLTHSLPLYALARALYEGVTAVLCRRFRPSAVLHSLEQDPVTVLYAVPTQIRLLAEAAIRHPTAACARLRVVLSSGAKWPEADRPILARAFPNASLTEFYGCSELSFITYARDGEAPAGSVGRAFPGVRLSIRDADGTELPQGETGLVFVDSPLRFLGYACGADESLMTHGDSLSVGDRGFLDTEGFLSLTGRHSRLIISAGKNIQPEEIEAVLATHPAVGAVAVLGVPDDLRGQRLVALITPQDGNAPPDRSALVAHARARLPLSKVPQTYALVHDWPRTASGKTDHAALLRRWTDHAIERLS